MDKANRNKRRDGASAPSKPARVSILARATLVWVGIALPLNLAWELAQLPLYTIWRDATPGYIAYALAHCTAGDGLIAGFSFIVVAAVTRRPDWPLTAPWLGTAAAIVFGSGYTLLSEWYNVYRLQSWAYTSSMPLVGGIGLAPLLQWCAVPLATTVSWRKLRRPSRLASGVGA